jgi:prepilin-type N-terminal cleavage/methylation domain-containing protein
MAASIARRLERQLAAVRDERGFSLVEVLVAILILGIASLAVFQVFDASTRTAFRAEQSQVAINVAQRELEEIRNLDYDQVALSSPPSPSSDENDPRHRVDGTRFDINRNGTLAEMVYDGSALDGGGTVNGGLVDSGPTSFQSGDISGDIYRFVVWRNDPECGAPCSDGTQDLKRVIVAVKLDTAAVSYERPYIEVQSDFIDPDKGTSAGPPDPGGAVVVASQLWLTDTTCDNSTRQQIQTDGGDLSNEGHDLHNTRGVCAHGLKTGSAEPGAPDLLDVEPPPGSGESSPPIYDYATDIERPPPDPDDDGGLQLPRQSADGCSYGAGSEQQEHRWVTKPIDLAALPAGFIMDGSATLELYLRTIGGAQHPATLCVFLFRRTAESVTVWTDVLIDSEQFLVNAVPSAAWDRVRIPLSFSPTTILSSQRLGLALAVERQGTPADTIQVLYDHPEARSRLEVATPTPLGE